MKNSNQIMLDAINHATTNNDYFPVFTLYTKPCKSESDLPKYSKSNYALVHDLALHIIAMLSEENREDEIHGVLSSCGIDTEEEYAQYGLGWWLKKWYNNEPSGVTTSSINEYD